MEGLLGISIEGLCFFAFYLNVGTSAVQGCVAVSEVKEKRGR